MIDAAGLFSVGSEQLGFGIIVAAQVHLPFNSYLKNVRLAMELVC